MLSQPDLFTAYKCMWMLKEIFDWIPCEQKAIICEKYLFVDTAFYKFFYHWSHFNRVLFYYLILYVIKPWIRKESLGEYQQFIDENSSITVTLHAKKTYVFFISKF